MSRIASTSRCNCSSEYLGKPDSGEPDSGEPDSGEPDADDPDADDPDAGEPDARSVAAPIPAAQKASFLTMWTPHPR
ncbi:hypothetical protein GCM10010411_32470 [Actinomadura fulvescens]|uniref:Uncharacterized protein n=1 Tax=Actinomadura fulvescens TaxID=46160 RepID=A0ABN3PR38_9ACTN